MHKLYLMIVNVHCFARGYSDVLQQLHSAALAGQSDGALCKLAFAKRMTKDTAASVKFSFESVVKVLKIFLRDN